MSLVVIIIVAEMFLASGVTAILYWIDKRAAQSGRNRVSEKTLLVACAAGGWPGGWIAANRLRHKTQKVSYRIAYWITVLFNLAVLAGIILLAAR